MSDKTNKTKAFIFCIVVYVLSVLVLTIFWINNWLKYEHYKGDEIFSFAEYILGLTILFYLIQIILIKRLKYLTLLFLPFGTIITTFILGLLLLLILRMGGTPNQTIYIYSVVYSLTNVLLSILIFNNLTKTKRLSEIEQDKSVVNT